jgi:2-polyprenyl-3-methyl-5-hydroxy-6-metoxy-1,4-benzoquinol methylase
LKKNSIFKESEIRPKETREESKVRDIIDTGRLLTRRSEFIEVPCPACQKNSYNFKFHKNQLRYLECDSCKTLYVSPRPTPKILSWFYSKSATYEYWNKVVFPASEAKRREKIFKPRVERILEICKRNSIKPDSLLEVGCAFGTFCEEMKDKNFFDRILGIEATTELAETCRQKGIEVKEGLIEDIDFPDNEQFSVVANFEVIEHLFEPKYFLEKCFSLLHQKGILVLTCPNIDGFDMKVLGSSAPSIDHEHLNYFSPDSIRILMEKIGFRILEISTPGNLDAEIVRKKIITGEFNVDEQPFLKEILINNWKSLGEPFQQFIADNSLSSNMWVVAQKNSDPTSAE